MPRDALDRDENRQRRRSRDPESNRDRRRDSDANRKTRARRASESRGHEDESPKETTTRKRRQSAGKSSNSKAPLSVDSLAQLDALNEKRGWKGFDEAYLQEVRAKEGRMERERRQEDKEAEYERRGADKREEGRQNKRERKRELKQLALERQREARDRQREAQDRQREMDVTQERQRYTWEHEVDPFAEDEHTTSEENKSQEMDDYWAKRTQHEQEKKEQRRVVSKSADGRLRKKRPRLASGAALEEGENEKRRHHRKDKHTMGDSGRAKRAYPADSESRRKRNKRICICIAIAVVVVILAVAIPIGLFVGKKKNDNNNGDNAPSASPSSTTKPSNSNLAGVSGDSIPPQYKGTYLDPFSWYDTTDFNVTFTDVMVGGLPIMGLNSTWDDSTQANPNVPALDQPWSYGSRPIRGVNVGGWLSTEPFITPSMFQKFSSSAHVIDEWTLTTALGSEQAKNTLEQHYSSFINAQTFSEIRAAGFDHVRIPFSYWAVVTYEGDPYVANVSWRYLLRGIEYCRLNGLRVNLDLHALPGSQNGWNHSGRQGAIGWLNGTDGDLNAQRSIDIHNQLSTFFAQPRYKNVIQIYGLVNEPRMIALETAKVINWTTTAISTVRANNLNCLIAFGDGFLGLDNWQGQLQGIDNLVLDVHQYVIFNDGQIAMKHSDKLAFACSGWAAQMQRSDNKATGFGPTLCGEWSQADTDCAQYLNAVGAGSRWEGTFAGTQTPQCPTGNSPTCECNDANGDPRNYIAPYKQWLLDFAEAQMESFESSWGWFYWTWDTETATQWSYKKGLAAGILPANVANRQFSCNSSIPDFLAMGLPENY